MDFSEHPAKGEAFGVSLGLRYQPGVFATLDELGQIAQLLEKLLGFGYRDIQVTDTRHPSLEAAGG